MAALDPQALQWPRQSASRLPESTPLETKKTSVRKNVPSTRSSESGKKEEKGPKKKRSTNSVVLSGVVRLAFASRLDPHIDVETVDRRTGPCSGTYGKRRQRAVQPSRRLRLSTSLTSQPSCLRRTSFPPEAARPWRCKRGRRGRRSAVPTRTALAAPRRRPDSSVSPNPSIDPPYIDPLPYLCVPKARSVLGDAPTKQVSKTGNLRMWIHIGTVFCQSAP